MTLILGSGVASAQAEHETDADFRTLEARTLFEAGRLAFQAGRFDSAFESFQRAYELSHRPALLFNMASAADRARRDAEALDHYERYLAEVPDAHNTALVRSRIEALRTSIGATDGGQRDGTGEALRPSTSATSAAHDSGSDWWIWTLVAVLAVGAVGIGVGVAVSTGGTEEPLRGNFGVDGVATALVRF